MCAFVRVRCQGREIQSHSANMIYNCKQTVHNCSNHFSNHSWSCWTARAIKWLSILEESRAVPSMRSKIHDNAQRRIDVRQPIDSTICRSCSSTSVTSASQSTTHMKSACLYSQLFCEHKHYVYGWLPWAFKAPCSLCFLVLIVLSLPFAVSEPETIDAYIVGFRKCYLQEKLNCIQKRSVVAMWEMIV